jgi:acetolactate synthase-1/2/3 large subunit
MRLNSYLHQRIRLAGTSLAFGVPGSYIMPIWQTFKSDPEIVLARHESGAAFMADGWSRVTGRLGVVLATIGPGLTNLVTGVASAYRDSTPLLVVTGQAPTASFGRGAFLESYALDRSTSPRDIFSPISKASLEIVDLANASYLIDTAIAMALSGRGGPVHLSVPVDLQAAELPDARHQPTARADTAQLSRSPLSPSGLATTAAKLVAAERPLILVGWGAARHGLGGDVEAIAEHLSAPVVCTIKAISCLPATHPLLAGHLGPGQRSDLVPFLRSYDPDMIVLLGVSLEEFYAGPIADLLHHAETVRVDVDPDQLWLRHHPDTALLGDLRSVLPDLRDAVVGMPRSNPRPAAEVLREFRERRTYATAAQPAGFAGGVSMAGTIARLGPLLPPDAIVVPDAGNHWLDTISLHQPQRSGGILLNCGLGAMGWGIGAAVGVALAGLGRKTVCVTGDGSMLMHGSELSVAAEHGADLLVLVFNNRSHGRIRLEQQLEFDGDLVATSLPDIDFAQWMSAMGIPSFTVSSLEDVGPVLGRAIGQKGTVGVEIRCHPDEKPACLRNWIEDA